MNAALGTRPLSTAEQEIWYAIKRLSETALARVAADIEAATGLSGADFGILTRLEDLGDGILRQAALAKSLGWHKARLSHQLTRMESRGLVRRDTAATERGVQLSMLPLGRQIIKAARPVHATAVRTHVLDSIDPEGARVILRLAHRITGSEVQ